ncbi:hypothetical protein SK128_004020 [Halocaridina rubra]|uniref:Uncharacterized protein n=1 Tax=Halocaridina rubra TaxID=373956 RepID=A0AAN8ZYY2_HALRR
MFQNDVHCLATFLAIFIIFIVTTEQIIGDIDASYLDRHRDDADPSSHGSTLPLRSSRPDFAPERNAYFSQCSRLIASVTSFEDYIRRTSPIDVQLLSV